ncbi:MAG: hypothetical protein KKC75_05785 [Nanoarchaeota archaeon]|nr:hypothetical protein [Nanoarchaeota archaeon]MBU1004913.1 hypothetical protein [Nanoarchaeota archaeon]
MEAALAEIRPNVKKAFISNLVFVGITVTLIIGIVLYLNSIVGLDVFLDTFREFGIEVSASSIIRWFIFFVILFTVLLLIKNYASLGKVAYTLYPDKLVYSKSLLIFQVSAKEIPYQNIAKISYEKKSTLSAGKIVIDLTGIKETKMELEFIDNPEEVMKQMQDAINKYRANYYAQYSQDYRFQNIMSKF